MLDRALWEDFVGMPFRHRGRGPSAYDCFGLVQAIYGRQGIDIPEVVYGFRPSEQVKVLGEHKAVAESSREYGWKPCEVKPGVVLLFRDELGGAAHVGVAIDDDRFIHASFEYDQVLVSRLSAHNGHFRKRLIGAYEYAVRR